MNRSSEGMYSETYPMPVQTMPAVENQQMQVQAQTQVQVNKSMQVQPVYQCEHTLVDKVMKKKEELIHTCKNHISRFVRVQTSQGEIYEGVIVNVDSRYLYLQVSAPQDPLRGYRAFFNPYYPPVYNPASNLIIPLVLYELLVISLML